MRPRPDRHGHIEAGTPRVFADGLQIPDAPVQFLEGIRSGRRHPWPADRGFLRRVIGGGHAEHKPVMMRTPLCEFEVGKSDPMEGRARIGACLTGLPKVVQEFLEPLLADRSEQFLPARKMVVGGLVRDTESAGQIAHRELELTGGHHLQAGPDAGTTEVPVVVADRSGFRS